MQSPSVSTGTEFPTLYRGVRPLGMGGAFITLSDDENAIFYNPAGLNDVKGYGRLEILNPIAEATKESIGLYRDIKDLDGSDIAAVTDFLNEHMGEFEHIRAALLPNVYFHNFELAILAQGTMNLQIKNPANPEVVTDAITDLGPGVGMAAGFWGRMLQVGASAKWIQRQGVNETFTADEIAAGNFDPLDNLERENDWSLDVGAKLNLPSLLKPTAAVVVQNITDLDFGNLGKIPQQINAGIAINPSIIGLISTSWVVEVDDLTQQVDAEEDFYKRVHLGTELRFPKILSLRGGVNQGYFTAGLTLSYWILRLDGAIYTEEVGTYAGQVDDQRYAAQISVGF
ncbi:MAG: hypothetical protein ACREIQ_07170 [Nitrospiria bacterium]